MYLLSTICVYRSYVWIWANNAIKKRNTLCIVWFFVKFQVHNILNKMPERLWANSTQRLWRCRHLFLADKKTFVLSLNWLKNGTNKKIVRINKKLWVTIKRTWTSTNLVSLPREATTEKKNKCVCEGFKVISPGPSSSQVGMHTSIANSAPVYEAKSIWQKHYNEAMCMVKDIIQIFPNKPKIFF